MTTENEPWDELVTGWRIGYVLDGRAVWVTRFMFTSAIVLGPENEPCYDDRWCYRDESSARAAARAWLVSGDPEPDGWHRHPGSGRRRESGDRAAERSAP